MSEQTPKVGDGATELVGSDRYPYTVIKVHDGKRPTLTLRGDKATRTDDRGWFTEQQDYEYEPDPDGREVVVTLRNDGRWRQRGDDRLFSIGSRSRYRDPSF